LIWTARPAATIFRFAGAPGMPREKAQADQFSFCVQGVFVE